MTVVMEKKECKMDLSAVSHSPHPPLPPQLQQSLPLLR